MELKYVPGYMILKKKSFLLLKNGTIYKYYRN
jgi:hypothetical protein